MTWEKKSQFCDARASEFRSLFTTEMIVEVGAYSAYFDCQLVKSRLFRICAVFIIPDEYFVTCMLI